MLFLCWKIVSINDGCCGTSLFFFERCYGLDVSSNIQMLKLNHQLIVLEGGAFKRWWSHEVGVVVDESSALIKGLEGMSSFSSALLPRKDTVFLFFFFAFCPFHHVRMPRRHHQCEMSLYQTQNLVAPWSWTSRSIFLFFINYPVSDILLYQQKWTKTKDNLLSEIIA